MPEAIEWAIQQTSLKHLALVGHSHAAVGAMRMPSRIAIVARRNPPMAETEATHDCEMVSHVQLGATREAQARFAEQLAAALRMLRWSASKSLDGDLAVYGLFFIAESEAFLAYDPDRKSFLP